MFEKTLKERFIGGILPGFLTVLFTSIATVIGGFFIGFFVGLLSYFFIGEILASAIVELLKEERILK